MESKKTPPFSTDQREAFVSLYHDTILPTSTLITRGNIPVPTFIALEPAYHDREAYQSFNALMGMAAMSRMYTAMNDVKRHQNANQTQSHSIDNPKEIGIAFNESADGIFRTLTTQPQASFYSSLPGETKKTKQSLTRKEVHDLVMKSIFDGIPEVNADMLKELDKVLTSFTAQLAPFNVESSTQYLTVNHCVVINYVKKVDIMGNGQFMLAQPFTRLVYLKIPTSVWNSTLQKFGGKLEMEEKFDFEMEYTVTDLFLEESKYREIKARYERIVTVATGDAQELNAIMQKGGIEELGRKTSVVFKLES